MLNATTSIRSFAIATIDNIQYNIVQDHTTGIYFFDTLWRYISLLALPNTNYMIVANNQFYFSMDSGSKEIITTPLNSTNIIASLNGSTKSYRSLAYISNNSSIIAANYGSMKIDKFYLNLSLISSYALSSTPYGIAFYN